MKELNKHIQRQLKKQFGSLANVPENMHSFLRVVSETFDHYDKDRKMLEHSISLSSDEMKALNQVLRKETADHHQEIYGKLKESLSFLNKEDSEAGKIESDYIKLNHIADVLKKETLKRKIAEEQRNSTEKDLIYANRIFRVISQINQLIVRTHHEDDLLIGACQIAVKYGEFKTAWLTILDENETLVIKASEGVLKDFTKLVETTKSLQYKVLKTGSYAVCNAIGEEYLFGEKTSSANKQDYGASIILPIKREDKIVGTFNLNTTEQDFFNATEIQLLIEATSDISFALDVFIKDGRRKYAEDKLKSSEWRLKHEQAIAHLGSWSLDFNTGIAIWSKEALKIYGIDTAQVEQSYQSWLSYIHPEDLSYVLEHSKKGQENQSPISIHYRIIRKDGEIRHIYAHTEFLFDEKRKAVGLYGVTHDVTNIKEKEQELGDSQSDLQAIFDSTSEGFILTGIDNKVKKFNNKIKEIILKNTGREIRIGDDLREFIQPQRKNQYNNVLDEISTGKTLQYQYAFKRKNDNVKWFNFMINPVYTHGEINGLVITTTDITESKLAEFKIKESEKRYSDLFQLNPLPMWVYSQKDLRFLDVNKAAIAHYGYSRKEFLSMTIKDIRPLEDLDLLETAIIKNKLKRSPVFHQSFRHLKKNGEIIEVEIQSNGILYQGMAAKIILAKDVTERFKYIKAIENQNEKLKEISWIQSHVVRAPLARIMALIPILESETDTPEETNQMLTYLKVSADELDEVIRNISEKTHTVDLKKDID